MNKQLKLSLLTLSVLLTSSFSSFLFQPPGLNAPEPIGKFLNGNLPSLTPGDGTNIMWSVVPAFPNLIFDSPLVITPHPRENRIFVASRSGLIEHFINDQNVNSKQTFVDLQNETGVVWDGGFLGLAFHPDFGLEGSPNRNYFYVYYTAKGDNGEHGPFACNNTCFSCEGNANFFGSYLRLARYSVFDGTLNVDKNSELRLFNIRQYNGTHRGGGLNFGKDGFLYLAIGDQARRTTAQDIAGNFEGGVIRIDVNQTGGNVSHAPRRKMGVHTGESDELTGVGYYIPNDNPWLDTNNGVFEEFYHNGHRNPHRMTMDRLTGEFWIGEVGASSREEVTIVKAGHNGGWPIYEGNLYRQFTACNSHTLPLGVGTYNPPVVDFLRTEANALIGGYVYRGSKFPSLYGKYICGGYSQNRLFLISENANGTYNKNHFLNFTPGSLITFGEGPDAEIYMGRQANSTTLYTLQASGANPPAPNLLSQTGAFSNLSTLTPTNGVIPYDMVEPFWSDGAAKTRWIAIPNDGTHNTSAEQIQFSENGNWTFPKGAVLIKHFELGGKKLETRFEVKGDDDKFYYLIYKWNSAGTDATLLNGPLDEDVSVNGQTQTWHYPGPSECLVCHQQSAGSVLGMRTRYVNKSITYPSTGIHANQLVTLSSIGALNQTITDSDVNNYITLAAKDDTNKTLTHRARSYLDINCAHCHQPATNNRAQFDARITTSLPTQNYINGPVISELNLNNPRLIVPQDVGRSMIHHRLNSLEYTAAMPPLAKNVVDAAGVQLIEDWINSLSPCSSSTFQDTDEDGTCDSDDCQPNDPAYPAIPGTACDDGDPNTLNDQVTADSCACEGTPAPPCSGIFEDTDEDGTCDSDDCQPNDPAYPAIPGTACDDGNPDTSNDQITADSCACAGTPSNGTQTEDCNGNTITYGNGQITLTSGGDATYFQVQNSNWGTVDHCGWNCGSSFTVSNLPAGTYRVVFQNAAYATICDKWISLSAGGNDPDKDGDGVPASQDCNDDDPNLTTAGASCNDNDPNTINDIVQADCTCAGTPTNGGETQTEDCNGNTITYGSGQITLTSGGDATYFQVQNSNWGTVDHCGWNCGSSFTVSNLPAGTYRVVFQNAAYATICDKWISLSAGGDDPDKDGDGVPASQDCNDDDPNLTTAGASCNDNDPNTINDVVQADCTCAGTPSGSGGTQTADCNGNTITYGNGQIILTSGGDAKYYKIYDAGWQTVGHCGWNCGNSLTVNGLSAGQYLVVFQGASYTTICEQWISLTNSSNATSAESRNTPHLSFMAFPANREIKLEWLTNTGYKNDFFIIEKSLNGTDFSALEKINNKAWDDDLSYYQIQDANPILGQNYYRVKQVYTDGSFSYSHIKQVDFSINLDAFTMYPNPARDRLYFNLKPFVGKAVHIKIFNTFGQELAALKVDRVEDGQYDLSLDALSNGLYNVIIQTEGEALINRNLVVARLY